MPCAEDGPAVTALIEACPPLDTNSAYCNLLQCSHFAETCVVAERDRRVVGWLSGHRPPATPDQIFAWQIAVHPSARGLGLARRLLDALLSRPALQSARTLTATITENNVGSWALFSAFARDRGMTLRREPLFHRDRHFGGAHETEWLAAIGPLAPPTSEKEDL